MKSILPACLFLLNALVFACGPGGSDAKRSVADHAAFLREQIRAGENERASDLHALRNLPAMVELVGALEATGRPCIITYLAAGAHISPIGLFDLLPAEMSGRLIMTEIASNTQFEIDRGLGMLERAGCLDVKSRGSEISGRSGSRRWLIDLGSREVVVELRVSDPDEAVPLVTPTMLAESDLVISHDWSGEPLGNLQVIREFLVSARANAESPPLLMIEDLSSHPYATDIRVFKPIVATSMAFGHRESEAGIGRHGRVELGQPIFGGAVLLTFADPWWRWVSPEELDSVFDFLLLNEFDVDRQNVLVGGSDPLLAPALLDWWTGYGGRCIDGEAIEAGAHGTRARMVAAATTAAGFADPEVARLFECRLALYRTLLAIRSIGGDTRDLMPAARFSRRPTQGTFPSEGMERQFRQALRRIGTMRQEREAFAAEAAALLGQFAPGPSKGCFEAWEEVDGIEVEALRQKYLRIMIEISGEK